MALQCNSLSTAKLEFIYAKMCFEVGRKVACTTQVGVVDI